MKKFFVCILVFCFGFSLFGCSQVSLSTSLKSKGEILTKVDFDLSESPNKSCVFDVCNKYFENLDTAYIENTLAFFSNIYDFEALNITTQIDKINYIILNNSHFAVSDKVEQTTKEIAIENDYKNIVFSRSFVSIYAYIMYFCPSVFEYNLEQNKISIKSEYSSLVDVPMNGEVSENEGIFISEFIQKFHPFYYNKSAPTFLYDCNMISYGLNIQAGQTLAQVLSTVTGLSEEDISLAFNFTTPFKRLHSDGLITQTSEGYSHSWASLSLDSELSVWRTYANYTPWYILAGSIGILVLIFGFFIVGQLRLKRKRLGLKTLNKIDFWNQNKK